MKEKHLYTFGEFSLNAEDHALSRNDKNIPLTPKMFDLLLVLVQNPKRVLTKEFLLQSVWPDSFVEEGNITFNIRQLRKALGDDAQSPTYIETIPRRGYRFLPAVETATIVADGESAPPPPEPVRTEPAPTARPRSRPYVLLGMVAFLLVAGALVFAGWFLKGGRSGAPILSAPLSIEKLSTDGGVFHIALSADGKNIVYTHRIAGKQGLWLRQLETSSNVMIIPPSDDFYGGLAISPDGNSVYFVRGSQNEGQLTIYRMPIFGGVPQKVATGTQGWISISSSGDRVSFVRCPYTDEEWCSLYIADALDGQNEKKLATRPRPFRIGDNKISPDGKTVAFAVGQSQTSSNEFSFAAVDIESGAERELTPQKFFNIGYIAWLPDQSGFLLTGMQLPDRNFRIWHVIGSTGEAVRLTSDSETYSRLSLDSSGRILVSTQVEPDFRLMMFQTDNPTAPPQVIGNAHTAVFGPDGRVYFSSLRTGNSEVWSANPDGSDLHQLTNDPGSDAVPIISPDNKTVFFQSARTGNSHIWRMGLDGSDQRQVTTVQGGFPLRVSPDGQWLYYRSALQNTLRRVPTNGGTEELVMNELGWNLIVSPDLSKAAFSRRENMETILRVVSVPQGDVEKSWRIAAPDLAYLAWTPDGQSLAYIIADDATEKGSLWFQKLDGGAPRRIADLSGDEIAELSGFALAPDGKTFAIIKGNWKHDAVLFRGLK